MTTNMTTNHIVARRLACLVLAAVALTVLTAACGSPTDRPLMVRISVRFDTIGKRTDPQPMLRVTYAWGNEPEQTLMRHFAGDGTISTELQRKVIHGNSYQLTLRMVREDTGEEIGFLTKVIAVPEHGEPWSSSINL